MLKDRKLMTEKKRILVYIIAIVEAVLFGMTFVGGKVCFKYLDPIQYLACRWAAAFTVATLLVLLGVIKVNYRGKSLKLIILAGLIQPCAYCVFEAWGINLTTSSESAIMLALIPVVVAIFSIVILKHEVDRLTWVGIVMALAGVICTVIFSESFEMGSGLLGYVFLIICVLLSSLYIIVSKKTTENVTPTELTYIMFGMGAVFFNIIAFASGGGISAYAMCFTISKLGLVILALAVCCTVFTYLAFNYVISNISAAKASTLQVNIITTTGVITGIIIDGDTFGWYTFVGLTLIVTGIIISNRK